VELVADEVLILMSKYSTTCGLALRGPEHPQLPLASSEAQRLQKQSWHVLRA